jgi:hypothetical protein
MKRKYKIYLATWMLVAAALYGTITTHFIVKDMENLYTIGIIGTLIFMVLAITGSVIISRMSKKDPPDKLGSPRMR